jgi:citrate lyase beta subunit
MLADVSLGLRSIVICLEDSVRETDLDSARKAFAAFVYSNQPQESCRVYASARPYHAGMDVEVGRH